ncbi:Cdc42-interacting protein 4 [Saguinus oedipus]|uniref:Cdc42-interacting protein 4 n=1 Tax=Saguinus oedipus TaxID=9490 RepID=A0ABQ9WE13_SAGOE|nr:Cdc42-interacting protein 4 [Saguinus oedipus]
MPQIFDKFQDMDERRAIRLGAGYGPLSEAELEVVPIIVKCLEGMKVAGHAVDPKNDSQVLIELHKLGFARPGDVEFDYFSQPMNRAPSDSSLSIPSEGRPELRCLGCTRAKCWPFGKKNKTVVTEDFSHLPPEQQRKRLQQQLEECNHELQKEVDQREALKKMKDVYEKTPQMGDLASLEPHITETLGNTEWLKLEAQRHGWQKLKVQSLATAETA